MAAGATLDITGLVVADANGASATELAAVALAAAAFAAVVATTVATTAAVRPPRASAPNIKAAPPVTIVKATAATAVTATPTPSQNFQFRQNGLDFDFPDNNGVLRSRDIDVSVEDIP